MAEDVQILVCLKLDQWVGDDVLQCATVTTHCQYQDEVCTARAGDLDLLDHELRLNEVLFLQ